jgi:hypothetical protein
MLKWILPLFLTAFSSSLYAYGTGYSSYPLLPESKLVSAELLGVTSTGGGVGIQARYTHKLNQKVTLDGGAGLSAGDRSNRFFISSDYELYPDYMKQPRISVKARFMNSKEFEVRRNVVGLAPTISKGFSFWGHEAFPYLSLPFDLSLDSEKKEYETNFNASFGITGNLPIEGYRKMTGFLEGTIGIKDSYTGIFLGVGIPL